MTYNFTSFVDLDINQINEVFELRNKSYVKEQMKNPSYISYQAHISFIKSLQSNKYSKYFLVQKETKKKSLRTVGVYSITSINTEGAEGGFYITEYAINNSLSIEFIYFSLKFVFENFSINKIYGNMLVSNRKALRLNNFFEFDVLNTKIFEGKEYLHSELTKDKWLNQVANRSDIIYLLKFTANQ